MTNAIAKDIHKSRLAGQVIGCTGEGPYQEADIKKIILEGFGTVGDSDIWQQDQVIVIGGKNFDTAYLLKSFEIGKRLGFTCKYMSQEDFFEFYLPGDEVFYIPNDLRIRNHEGLSFLKSKYGWPPRLSVRRVNWRILPPGEYPFARVIGYFRQIRRSDGGITIDEDRLSKICSLGPNDIYIGTDEFRRYMIFYFAKQQRAILECPIVGNAIYVINGDWETLSQYSKAELLWYFSNQVTRVIHKGDWFYRLQDALYL